MRVITDILPSRTSIRRKPLPPDSPYSAPNSPRRSKLISHCPLLTSLKPSHVNPPPPTTQTSFVQNKSIKQISLGSSDPAEQEPLKLTSHNSEPKSPPVNSNYTYRALLENEYSRRTSDARFPMRSKSFESSVRGRRGSIIFVVVLVIVLVAVLAGIGIGKSLNNGKGVRCIEHL